MEFEKEKKIYFKYHYHYDYDYISFNLMPIKYNVITGPIPRAWVSKR